MTVYDRIISAIVKTNGEVIEYHVQSPGELAAAFEDVEAHIQAYRDIKSSMMATSMEMLKKQDKEVSDADSIKDK